MRKREKPRDFLRMGLSEILKMCYNEDVASNRNAHFHCQVSI